MRNMGPTFVVPRQTNRSGWRQIGMYLTYRQATWWVLGSTYAATKNELRLRRKDHRVRDVRVPQYTGLPAHYAHYWEH